MVKPFCFKTILQINSPKDTKNTKKYMLCELGVLVGKEK
jgi:hypothetical protein